MKNLLHLIQKWLRMNQEFMFPAALLGVSFIITVVGIIPGAQKTYDLWNQLQAEREEVSLLRQKEAFLANLDEASLFKDLSTVTSLIPISKSIPSIFATIEGVSAKTGSVFSNLQVDSPGSIATEAAKQQSTEEAALGSYLLPFSLTMEGSYVQLRDTLVSLTTSRRLLRAKSMTITLPSEGPGRATILMDTLYAPLPKGTPGQRLLPLSAKDNETLSRISNLPLLYGSDVAVLPVSGVTRPDPFSP